MRDETRTISPTGKAMKLIKNRRFGAGLRLHYQKAGDMQEIC